MTMPVGAELPVVETPGGEIFSLAQLTNHARHLAAEHAGATASGPLRPLLREFRRTRDDLVAAYREIESAARAGGARSETAPAEEWLLDNFHVVDQQFREIVEDLPRGYLVQLPRLAAGPAAGCPRVYLLALDLIGHTDARLDQENLLHYVKAYQERAPLTIGELWAVPIMLRLGLVGNLVAPARQELLARAERVQADRWADRILTRARERSLDGVVALAELAKSEQALTDGFVAQLVKRLRAEDLELGPAFTWIEDRLSEADTTVEEVIRRERHRQSTNQVSVGNSITSMRLIGTLDWATFFEQVSLVERELRRDPAQAYAAMDSSSRDGYRRAIEQLARRSGISEQEVASRAVDRASQQSDPGGANERRRHVGYYLVDDGRIELESEIGYRSLLTFSWRIW